MAGNFHCPPVCSVVLLVSFFLAPAVFFFLFGACAFVFRHLFEALSIVQFVDPSVTL